MDLYHLINRGVDRRDIFMDDTDRHRFVYGLWSFNNVAPIANTYTFSRTATFGPTRSKSEERKPLVDIHAWCVMNNHYHLLVSAREEKGITRFITKLNVGYAKYFNERHARTGTLFQGRTRKVLIDRDAHFLYILHYIHLNPLDYLEGAKTWRERDKKAVQNTQVVLEYLNGYRWSSYLDYIGNQNFPSLISNTLRDPADDYQRSIGDHLSMHRTEKDLLSQIVLE